MSHSQPPVWGGVVCADVPRSFAQRVVAHHGRTNITIQHNAQPQESAALISERGTRAGFALVPREHVRCANVAELREASPYVRLRAFTHDVHVRTHGVLPARVMRHVRARWR